MRSLIATPFGFKVGPVQDIGPPWMPRSALAEIAAALPQRRPDPDTELGVCTVCHKTWREAEDCKTPADCNFVRETKP